MGRKKLHFMPAPSGRVALFVGLVLLLVLGLADANMYAFGNQDGMYFGSKLNLISAWTTRTTGDSLGGYYLRMEDAPSKVVITDKAVYMISSQSRFLIAWGRGFFGLRAATMDGSVLAQPTKVDFLDFFGWRDELSSNAFLDIAAPDDGSFVVALVALSGSPTQYSGQIYTWGVNNVRQLGRDASFGATIDDVPGKVAYSEPASAVYAGADFALVLQPSGRIWGWGANTYGQLLNDPATTPIIANPTLLAADWAVTSLAVGKYHVAALWQNGSIFTWGRNDTAQLGWLSSTGLAFSYIPGWVGSFGSLANSRATKVLAGDGCFMALIDKAPADNGGGGGGGGIIIGVLGGGGSTGESALVGWGLNVNNWLGIRGAPLDPYIVAPQTIDKLNPQLNQVRDIAFRKNIGIVLFEERNLLWDKSRINSVMAHWGPAAQKMESIPSAYVLGPDGLQFSKPGSIPITDTYNWQYYTRVASKSGKASAIVRVWAGENAVVVTTEDGSSYIWGSDEKADLLFASPDPNMSLGSITGTILKMDQGDSLARSDLPNLGTMLAPMPSPDGHPLLRTIVFSAGDQGKYGALYIYGDWFHGGASVRLIKPAYLNTAEFPNDYPLTSFQATTVLSWGVGARHIILLSQREGVNKIWSCGDPDDPWGVLGFPVTDRNLASARLNIVSIPGLASDNITLVTAGPTSSWAVVLNETGQSLFWWGKFAGNSSTLESVPLQNVRGRIISMSVGWHDNAFFVDDSGRAYSMGINTYDGYDGWLCLGVDGIGLSNLNIPFEITLSPHVSFASVAAGGSSVAFLQSSIGKTGGDVYQCGLTAILGLNDSTLGEFVDFPKSSNLTSLGIAPVSQIAVGGSHTVLLSSAGVFCHGNNSVGQCSQSVSTATIAVPTQITDKYSYLKGRMIDTISAGPDLSFLTSSVKISAGVSQPTVPVTAYSDVIRIPGTSMAGEASQFNINLMANGAFWYQTWLGQFFMWLQTENVISSDYNEPIFSCPVYYVDPYGKYVLCRMLAQGVDNGHWSNPVSVPYYLTKYMTLNNITSGQLAANFYQGNTAEHVSYQYFDMITVYKPVIDSCGPVCKSIPISATRLHITGVAFGTSTSPQEVSVQLSDGQCIVTHANETELICEVVVGFSSFGTLKAIVWRGDKASLFESWMLLFVHESLWTPIYEISAAPSVSVSTTEMPWNAPNLTLSVAQVASESGQVNASALGVTLNAAGMQIECPVISASTNSIVCNTTGLLPSNLRGSISASIARESGRSDPAFVATIVQQPTISINQAKKYAANAKRFSLEGVSFGTSKNDVAVVIGTQPGANKRSGTSDLSTRIIAVSNNMIEFGLQDTNALLPQGQNLSAVVFRLGAPSEVAFFATIVPQPILYANSEYKRALTAQELTIKGANLGSDPSKFSITFGGPNPAVACSVSFLNDSTMICSLSGLGVPGLLSATVTVYGGQSENVTVAEIVQPPKITVNATNAITENSTMVTIAGEGFDMTLSTLSAVLSYDSTDANSLPCSVSDVKTNSFVCNALPLITKGSLFARVASFGGWSSWAQVGVVGNLEGGSSNTNLAANSTVGVWIAIGAAGLVIIVAIIVIIVLRRRHVNMQKRNKIDIPQEMEYMFNIRASDLELISKLGEGSFGAVWLGKYKGSRHVAIKKLTASVLGSQVAEFFREAALMSAIKPHPNVVRTLGMCQEMGNLSLVMEFLSGGCLDRYLKQLKEDGQEISENELFKIVIGIARGMAHLAESHIVHRDLAARNILLDGNHEPRISDFGFSRVVGDNDQGAKTNSTVGPIRWMSPENIGAMEYSTKSDVWSFGIILYEITQAEPPYVNEDLLSVATAIRDRARTPMADMKRPAPKYIADLMQMCFKVLPDDRPSFHDIVEYLLKNAPSAEALASANQIIAGAASPAISPPSRANRQSQLIQSPPAQVNKKNYSNSNNEGSSQQVEMQNMGTREYDSFGQNDEDSE